MKATFIEKLIGKMDRLDAKSVASIVERLAQEKGFLETVFHALDEGVIVLSSDHKLLYLNRASRTLLGLPEDMVPGDSLDRHLPDVFWEALREDRRSAHSPAAVHDVEVSYPQHRFLQIYTNTLSPEEANSDILLILRDVTQAQRQAMLNAESERLGAVTTLAAGVAHEIGNPLNSLHIYMQLIQRELQNVESPAREKLEKHLGVCMGEIARLDQILHQFLKAVRPTKPSLKPTSPNSLLLEVLEVLTPEIENRDILVEKDFNRDLPLILVDPDQMKQVFFNLIRNSLQAMTKEGILHLKTGLHHDKVVFTVKDTGGGISPEVLQHIFEPYFTTKKEGSGLGLMIVQRVIREHGGLIEVSSEKDRGTTFRIHLPTAEKRIRLLESQPSSVHSEPESGTSGQAATNS
jgi:two-component system, sporulation sensor kinase E